MLVKVKESPYDIKAMGWVYKRKGVGFSGFEGPNKDINFDIEMKLTHSLKDSLTTILVSLHPE